VEKGEEGALFCALQTAAPSLTGFVQARCADAQDDMERRYSGSLQHATSCVVSLLGLRKGRSYVMAT